MNGFDEERIKFRDMVGKQRDAIEQLLELSSTHYGLLENSMITQLNTCKAKCDRLYKKLDKDEFEIAIVGLEKAGKSTFGNALMGNRILPDADERCTYTSTCIRYGNDRAVVKFYSSSEMDAVLRGYLTTLGISNPESYTYITLSKSEYNTLFSKLDERDKSRYENTVHQDVLNLIENKNEILSYIGQPEMIFEGDSLYSDNFKTFIVSPKIAVAVKEVSIESSRLDKLQNAVIYDVPGFDSPTSMHLEQTKNRMKEADAIMLVASAEKPSFTAPALKMFQDVVDEDNVSLSDKLFIFGNRADGASTLSKNIETLKGEARKWKLLSESLLNDRIMVGSAKAHLQKLGAVDGHDLIEKVERPEYKAAWSHGDGIEYAHDKLVEYNQIERFPILKKKVLRNNEELRDMLNVLIKKYNSNTSPFDYNTLLSKNSELIRSSRNTIQHELESLRAEIREKYSSVLSLSIRLQEKINEMFEDGKFNITDEEIKEEDLKNDGVGTSINIEAVDERIREKKFQLIYEEFSQSAFQVAQDDHSDYYMQIVNCFEKALNIVPKSPSYDDLHNTVIRFIDKYRKDCEDDFIYQPLIERFVRDIVEVLIRYPYSSEARCRKFVDEAEVFSGLVLFYNPGDANEGFKRQFLSVAPKNQPLLLALLFHDYKEAAENSRSAISVINNICKGICDIPEIIQLIFSIVKLDPIGGVAAISKMVNKESCKNCKTIEDYARSIISSLRNVKTKLSDEGKNDSNHSTKKYNFDFTNKQIFEGQYKQYFGETPLREYSDLCEFFSEDLEILQKFLIHASIPAIRLEKPFIAREVQSINKLLDAVSSAEFDTMINNCSRLLLPAVYEELNRTTENYIANKHAIAEVEKIMSTLNSFETA